MLQRVLTLIVCLAVMAVQPALAPAVPIIWTDWTEGVSGAEGSATGFLDIGGEIVEVTYTGESTFIQTNGGTNYYCSADHRCRLAKT